MSVPGTPGVSRVPSFVHSSTTIITQHIPPLKTLSVGLCAVDLMLRVQRHTQGGGKGACRGSLGLYCIQCQGDEGLPGLAPPVAMQDLGGVGPTHAVRERGAGGPGHREGGQGDPLLTR